MIPSYLSDVGVVELDGGVISFLATSSAVVLYGTLISAGLLIVVAMIKGKREAALHRGAERDLDAGVTRALSSITSK